MSLASYRKEPVAWTVGRSDRSGAMVLRLPFLREREEMEHYKKNNPDETLVALYASPLSRSAIRALAAKEKP